MANFSCPLCSVSLSPSNLEAHLRQELDYPDIRCLLCQLHFSSEERATEHFQGPLARHPDQPLRLSCLEKDPVKEQRLLELVRLARGREEFEKRLCVCGTCRLVCRDARPIPGPKHDEPPKEVEVPEKSEEEEQRMLVDVKPDINELKPQMNTDGKVACIKCGMRIEKAWFKQHIVGAHSTAEPFSCTICPHKEKSKAALAKHQMKDHETQLSEETFIFVGSETKIQDLVEQCFGEAKNSDWARLRCQPCDKLVNKKHLKFHIAMTHVKKVLHSCKLCGFISRDLSAGAMNTHVKKQHKRQPGPDTIDSSQAQHYAPIIKNMISELFG